MIKKDGNKMSAAIKMLKGGVPTFSSLLELIDRMNGLV